MSPRTPNAPAVLARHGVPPDADAAALVAALEARGWQVRVEEPPADAHGRGRQSPQYRALAFRRRPADAVEATDAAYRSHDHRQAVGRTAEAALARVLAAVLALEG